MHRKIIRGSIVARLAPVFKWAPGGSISNRSGDRFEDERFVLGAIAAGHITVIDIAESCTLFGIPLSTVRKRLRGLVVSGRVVNLGSGRYGLPPLAIPEPAQALSKKEVGALPLPLGGDARKSP